ncbi:WD40/YVTN/BNR-like repeat-containing protein [Pseudomonas jessenii]|uniref:WD40/YVTN/BNR-like repeat-containing protein n=1 Tax=Pseudomonas jessenii TaxID=77298 RepID=UPI003891C02F
MGSQPQTRLPVSRRQGRVELEIGASSEAQYSPSRTWLGLFLVGMLAVGSVASFLPRPIPAVPPTRVQPQQMSINGVTQVGTNLVAAGELGHLFVSRDAGRQWDDASVSPQRGSTLTQVFSANQALALAVGHDGWILRSEDAGQSWKEASFDGEAGNALMSVWGNPAGPFFAVGSFGSFVVSIDQGQTWQQRNIGLGDRHLYGVAGTGPDRMMLVGESGLAARSTDGGQNWTRLSGFYTGSLFGLIALSGNDWLAYGMRGKVFRSSDFGQSWTPIETGTERALYGATLTRDGRVVLVGEGGVVIVSADRGESFQLLHAGGGPSFSSVGQTADGRLIYTGQQGIAFENIPLETSNH